MARVLLALCLAVSLLTGCKQGDASQGNGGKPQVAVIPKGTTHEFWKSVEAGAKQAGKDFDVDVIWKGPLNEDDRSAQINLVQQFVGDRVAGIVLAPLDSRALVPPVQLAEQQHIPVVIIDSGLDAPVGQGFISFVATDNRKGGQMAGEELARLLNGKGTVVLLPYAEGSASTLEREAGFMEVIGKHPEMHVVGQGNYGGPTTDHAEKVALNMIDQIKQADGIFCSNESNTAGMLAALRTAGIAGKARFVGFDASPQLVEALKNKELDGLISQDPFRIGYDGVKAVADHLHGKPVAERVDTGVHLITRENVNDPEILKLFEKH